MVYFECFLTSTAIPTLPFSFSPHHPPQHTLPFSFCPLPTLLKNLIFPELLPEPLIFLPILPNLIITKWLVLLIPSSSLLPILFLLLTFLFWTRCQVHSQLILLHPSTLHKFQNHKISKRFFSNGIMNHRNYNANEILIKFL